MLKKISERNNSPYINIENPEAYIQLEKEEVVDNKWYEFSDVFPPDCMRILITHIDKYIWDAEHKFVIVSSAYFTNENGLRVPFLHSMFESEITHWMKCPEPPKVYYDSTNTRNINTDWAIMEFYYANEDKMSHNNYIIRLEKYVKKD